MRFWSVTIWLIAINVAVFLLDWLSHGLLSAWGRFSVPAAIGGLQIWRFVTFQFLHADIGHIVFNMLSLYFFGPLIERHLGGGRYLAYYLACGIAGAVVFLVLSTLGVIERHPHFAPTLVGASAGIFGILAGAAHVAPNATVMAFGVFPMKMKALAWGLIAVGLFVVLSNGNNAGGQAAHLGGAALGALLIRNPRWLDAFEKGPIDGSRRIFHRWKQERRWRKSGDRSFRMDDRK